MQSPLYQNTYRVPSTRLPQRDYGLSDGYFVTICTTEFHTHGSPTGIDVETLHATSLHFTKWDITNPCRIFAVENDLSRTRYYNNF